MSKKIRILDVDKESLVQEIINALGNSKLSDGKFTFAKDFSKLDRKAAVYMTEIAYLKIQTLVQGCDKEIAWRGTAERLDSEYAKEIDPEAPEDAYLISDIFCYPQIVTGTTVTTDDKEEMNWYASLDDDVLNNLKFQGHSHVNMGVTPSGTDRAFYDDILQTIPDDGFYIFMIWNKKGDRTIKIYDMAKNIFFDTEDCKVKIMNELGILQFQSESLAMVKERKYTYTPTTPTTTTPAATTPTTSTAVATKNNDTKDSGKKKMKRVDLDDEEDYWKGRSFASYDCDDYYDNYYYKQYRRY